MADKKLEAKISERDAMIKRQRKVIDEFRKIIDEFEKGAKDDPLVTEMEEIRKKAYCNICQDEKFKNVAFIECGHGCCLDCWVGKYFKQCPFCRQVISRKLDLYF